MYNNELIKCVEQISKFLKPYSLRRLSLALDESETTLRRIRDYESNKSDIGINLLDRIITKLERHFDKKII